MVSSIGNLSVCADNSDVDEPLTGEKRIELQMECDAASSTVVSLSLCIYLTDQPFKEGNGTYHTISVPLNLTCTGLHLCMYTCICTYVY